MGLTDEGDIRPRLPEKQRIETLRWIAETNPLPEIRNSQVAVILLGQGIRLGENRGFNRVNILCTQAAGEIANQLVNLNNSVDLYMISRNADKMQHFLESHVLLNRLNSNKISLIKNHRSGSTADQAKGLAEIIEDKSYDRTVLVVPSYHILRSKRVLEAYRIKVDEVRSAEKVLGLPPLDNSAEVVKEGILLFEQRFDPKQRIPRAIRKLRKIK